jgi:hypothetical protein
MNYLKLDALQSLFGIDVNTGDCVLDSIIAVGMAAIVLGGVVFYHCYSNVKTPKPN